MSEIREALYAAWDDGNAVGLDGWIGPERGEEPDEHAIHVRERHIAEALAALAPTVERIRREARAEEREWWQGRAGSMATSAHAMGHSDRRRALLDLLALDERRADRIEAD